MKNLRFPFQSGIWLIVGLIASALAIFGFLSSATAVFLQAYLFAYVFWLGITLGCLAIALITYLTQSSWGYISRWILESASKTIWLMLILFIPIAFGVMWLYVWAVPANVQADVLLAHKSAYLNIPAFLMRAALYFAVWIILTHLLTRLAQDPDTYTNLDKQRTFRTVSAVGLLLYFFTISFASIDWIMSLTPEWYSTIFGLMIILGQALSAFAFVALLLPQLANESPLNGAIKTRNFQDLGGLLLTCVMSWAYMAFSQLLIIWSGNIPAEITWYFDRSHGGWLWTGILIAIFQFAVPFVFLLSTHVRQDSSWLAGLSFLILVVHLIDNFWMIMPAFYPRQFVFHWLDIVLPVAIGGLWMAAFAWFVRRANFFLPEKLDVAVNSKSRISTTH